jgi:hypothetical protein
MGHVTVVASTTEAALAGIDRVRVVLSRRSR